LGILGETLVRRFSIGLVAGDKGRKRAIVDGLVHILRVTEPGEHFVGQDTTPLLERSAALKCFEVEMQAYGPRQVASATSGGTGFPVLLHSAVRPLNKMQAWRIEFDDLAVDDERLPLSRHRNLPPHLVRMVRV
jgi:hypothetical protein